MLKIVLILKLFILSNMVLSNNLYNFTFKGIDGKELKLKSFKNKVVLIVNTASMCGFTRQFESLENIYQQYREKGLVVIGVPSNSFKQEYTNEEKVKDFCETKFNITFPMTKITAVVGENKHEFYKWLSENYDVKPKWNFYKIIFNKKGEFIDSFSPITRPNSDTILNIINSELNS